jgi:hypothetical protein
MFSIKYFILKVPFPQNNVFCILQKKFKGIVYIKLKEITLEIIHPGSYKNYAFLLGGFRLKPFVVILTFIPFASTILFPFFVKALTVVMGENRASINSVAYS